MGADPDIAVYPQNKIDLPAAVSSFDCPDLSPSPYHTSATAGADDGEEDAVAEFPVLQAPGVQACGAVLVNGLNLCDEHVTLGKKGADG